MQWEAYHAADSAAPDDPDDADEEVRAHAQVPVEYKPSPVEHKPSPLIVKHEHKTVWTSYERTHT